MESLKLHIVDKHTDGEIDIELERQAGDKPLLTIFDRKTNDCVSTFLSNDEACRLADALFRAAKEVADE